MSLVVLLAVTHLLGAGHLTRAAAIGRALARAGHRVTLVSGGMPASLVSTDGLALVQLPPLRTIGEDFSRLSDEAGHEVGQDRLDIRRDLLLATLDDARPDVVITELFPFGRRVLAAEFRALISAAKAMRPKPLMLCSLRDILVAPVKPGRVEEAHRQIAHDYDAVLVHGDPTLVRLDESWPVDRSTASRVIYTGYVDAAPPLPARPGPGPNAPILVSGGSSAAALPLYGAALAAARLVAERRWRILVGGSVSDHAFATLRATAPPNVAVERARPDFRQLLHEAGAFVGLAGYNTVVDLIDARVPAVLVPFEQGRETEQRLRAERLAARGLALLLPQAELSPENLAEQVRRSVAAPRPPEAALRRDGAEETVRIVEHLASSRAERLVAPATPRPALAPSIRAAMIASLDRLADEGRSLPVWWRDDDAVAHTPALDRLLTLQRHAGVTLAIAAVPAGVQPSLVDRLAEHDGVAVLVHGLAHTNHAPEGAKKAEFGPHRPVAAMRAEAAGGLALLKKYFGARAMPVFVPPWNRIAPNLACVLHELGYLGLSTFGGRSTANARLVTVNTHIDPLDWHGSGSLLEADALRRMWERAIAERGAGNIGLLTHHLVSDEAIWSFCEAVLEILVSHPAVRFATLAKLWLPASTPLPDGDARGGDTGWANA